MQPAHNSKTDRPSDVEPAIRHLVPLRVLSVSTGRQKQRYRLVELLEEEKGVRNLSLLVRA